MPDLPALLRTSLLVLVATLPTLAHARADKPVACKDPQGRVTLQLPPCPVFAPLPPPAPRPACTMTNAEIDRAIVREKAFLLRYKTREAHETARQRDLQAITTSARATLSRLRSLQADQQALLRDIEFYKGKQLPANLQAAVDATTAQLSALVPIFRQLEDEVARVQARFACERETFGPSWDNQPPGSSGCTKGCATG